ncbi:MAG: ABC transporter ATP-binding protein [Promethearchaeota archaeon]
MTLVKEKIISPKKKREVILSVKDLKTYYPILGGLFKRKIGEVKAVDGVTFNLYKRETLGLVGESGCGKTTIGNTILNLVRATSGEIFYKNQRIVQGMTKPIEKKERGKLKYLRLYPAILIAFKIFLRLLLRMQPHIKKFYHNIHKVFHSLSFLFLSLTLSVFSLSLSISSPFLSPSFVPVSISLSFASLSSFFLSLLVLGRLPPNVNKTFQHSVVITTKKSFNRALNKFNPFTKELRKKIQIVFQDPDASLNPRWKIVDIIGEPLRILQGITKRRDKRKRVLELLETVSMKAEHLDRYPHEFSGGQKQRIVIARALACNPEIIILDEPTSALDVSVQAQILNLLKDLQVKFDLSFLFITHDLSVVQHIADRIAVMYLGKFVEEGKIDEVFYNPTHPYSKALLSARPTFDPSSKKERIILEGDVPSPINPPSGCAFHPRCPEKDKHNNCGIESPKKIYLGGDHYMYCLPLKQEKKSYEGMKFISD